MKLHSYLFVGLSLLPACAADEDPGRAQRPIVGGVLAAADDAVVALTVPIADGSPVLVTCSGVVISPRTVLTAASCVDHGKAGGFIDLGRVQFGSDQGNPDRVVAMADARSHRQFVPTLVGKYDIAVVLLAEDAMVTPLELNDQPLEGVIEPFDGSNGPTMANPCSPGETGCEGVVRSLGYGAGMQNEQTGALSGAGTRRSGILPVRTIAPRHLTIADLDNFVCEDGDEGGPDLFVVGGTEKVIAIHAGLSEQTTCATSAVTTRVDAVVADFIIPAIDAWEGPCLFDGNCVTTGCRTPDPDCDPCGPEGTCTSGCPAPDWDCPLGSVVGETCAVDEDCETRRCLPATDDPRITYCSDTCSAGSAALDCGDLICATVGAEELCVWPEPTPGAQGSACQTGATDCRSTFCDLEYHVCVEPCDPEMADACPTGFNCSPSSLAPFVCRPPAPEPSCACRTGAPTGAPIAPLFLAAGVALLLFRRRRR